MGEQPLCYLVPPPGSSFEVGATYIHWAEMPQIRWRAKCVITVLEKEWIDDDWLYTITTDAILEEWVDEKKLLD